MYFEPEVLPLMLIGFSLVLLAYGAVLFRIARESDSDTRFPCVLYVITLLFAFGLFLMLTFPELFSISRDDRMFGGTDSVNMALCGTAWAFSMFFNACILWNLHKKKK